MAGRRGPAIQIGQRHQATVELDEPFPAEVDAGTPVTFKVRVRCPSACDLRGGVVKVMVAGAELITTELSAYDGKSAGTEGVTLIGPPVVGEHAWNISFERLATGGLVHEEGSLPVRFRTRPHDTSLAVWDVVSPVVMSSSFAVKVGVRCSVTCRLAGQWIEVRDEEGKTVGRGQVGDVPWGGTDALYWTEVKLAAPATEGVVSWVVNYVADLALPHGQASCRFGFAIVRPPEHRVAVTVVEQETGTPIENAQVRLGAHRAATDVSGSAKIQVATGVYDLKIWKAGYEASTRTLDVMGDIAVRVATLVVPEDPTLQWR